MGPTQHLKPSEKPLRPQLLIVQPYLTAYRLPVFAELAAAFQGTLLASSPPTQGSGYGETQISRFRHGILLLRMVLFAYRKLKAL